MRQISPEAQAFLDEPFQSLPYQLDPHRIDGWRAAIREGCVPLVEREITRLGVTMRDVEIGGTPCMEVTPPDAENRTILYCFGGGFVSGSAYEDLPISASLAVSCKARVVAPHYRLAPEHPHPAAFNDGWAVALALAAEDTPFALAGESAGGNLALALAAQLAQTRFHMEVEGIDMGMERLQMPTALALLSPWCDLTHSGDSLTANDGRDPTLALADVQQAAVAYADGRDLADPAISPLNAVFVAGVPPTILTTGTRDLLLSSTIQLADVLREAGVEVDLRVWDRMWHVFEFYGLPESGCSLADIARFLNRYWSL